MVYPGFYDMQACYAHASGTYVTMCMVYTGVGILWFLVHKYLEVMILPARVHRYSEVIF